MSSCGVCGGAGVDERVVRQLWMSLSSVLHRVQYAQVCESVRAMRVRLLSYAIVFVSVLCVVMCGVGDPISMRCSC